MPDVEVGWVVLFSGTCAAVPGSCGFVEEQPLLDLCGTFACGGREEKKMQCRLLRD